MTFGPAYDQALARLPEVAYEIVATTELDGAWVLTDAATNVYGVRVWTVTLSDAVAAALRQATARRYLDERQAVEAHHATANLYRITTQRTG